MPSKEWYEKNKERVRLYTKNYRLKNPEKKVQWDKKYYEKNKEKRKLWQKEYIERNKEQIKITRNNYRVKNRKKLNESANEYRINNRVEIRVRHKGHMKKYRVSWKGQITSKRAKAIRRTAKFQITPEKLEKAFNKTDGFCPYCGDEITKTKFSLDHIKPISKQGTNHLNNLIACCNTCNSKKGNMSLRDFRQKIAA